MIRLWLIFGSIAMLYYFSGCTPKPSEAVNNKTYCWTGGYDGEICTVIHDNHKFVVFYGMNGRGGIIHHPGCECLTTKGNNNVSYN